MPVQVTVNPYLSSFDLCYFSHELLGIVKLWMEILVRVDPLSIQVDSCDRVTIVATHDTIRVQTRYQDKSVVKPQKFRFLTIGQQELQDALKYKGGRCLPRVDSRGDHDDRLSFQFG